jgi:gas vesicle protein
MSRYDFDDDQPYVVIERHSESGGVGAFLFGIALGAGVALLLAPRSGAATRRDIKLRARRVRRAAENVATEVTDTVVDTFQEARRRVEDQIDSALHVVDVKREQMHRAMEAGRAAAREARDELEQRIAESKAAYRAGGAAAHGGNTNVATADENEEG